MSGWRLEGMKKVGVGAIGGDETIRQRGMQKKTVQGECRGGEGGRAPEGTRKA